MLIRHLVNLYRRLQYTIYHRETYGILSPGKECKVEPYEWELNHGDIVHPCVRYIPNGYLGHKWWMVYTPYYNSNDKTENPILCYSESDSDYPPNDWKVAYQVQKQPQCGYNSDPTLFFDEGKLYVVWRESQTERCNRDGHVRACYGAIVLKKGIGEVFGPLIFTDDYEVDKSVSPTFVKMSDGTINCFAMHLKFHSRTISGLPDRLRVFFRKIATALDVIGVWSEQKGYGVAEWSASEIQGHFHYINTSRISNCNKLYRPWHMDLFDWNNKVYGIVQSNQCNADICLAEYTDGNTFRFYNKPLMTSKTCEKVGIYKPTGGLVNDVFYLYYTAQDPDNRSLNKLYLSVIDIKKLESLLRG